MNLTPAVMPDNDCTPPRAIPSSASAESALPSRPCLLPGLTHPRRSARRAARRAYVLAILRNHDTLGAGMRAAGVTWCAVKAMMRDPGFREQIRALRTVQRQRRPHRHRAENASLTRALQAAGLPRAVACAEVRRMHRQAGSVV